MRIARATLCRDEISIEAVFLRKGTVTMVSRYEKFSFIISEIGKNLHKISSDEMKKFGLRGSLAKYIIILHRHRDGVTATQLCELCDRNKADVSRAMAELMQLGIVERLGDASYRVKYALSDEGKKLAHALASRAALAISCVSGELNSKDLTAFYKALDVISKNLEKLGDEGLPQNGEDCKNPKRSTAAEKVSNTDKEQ